MGLSSYRATISEVRRAEKQEVGRLANRSSTPGEARTSMRAEVTRPHRNRFDLSMPESEPGRFEANFVASQPGLYAMRLRALGTTHEGRPLQREQTASAVVAAGGNRPPRPDVRPFDAICRLVARFLQSSAVDDEAIERLMAQDWNVKTMRACLNGFAESVQRGHGSCPVGSRRADARREQGNRRRP